MQETIKFVLDEERKKKLKEFIKQGYKYKCLGCGMIYKVLPAEPYEDGHGGRELKMCRCGSDLFKKLEDIDCRIPLVYQENGAIVLKEHNFKYCNCDAGEVWTGDAETECHAEFDNLGIDELENRIFRCEKSGIKILLLKSTSEEMANAGFIRLPG
ncbi:MAG: hypothetical protein ABIJ28_03415 [Patescibacteria group bacterium]